MRLLFLGDIVGRAGRQVVLKHLADLRAQLKLDAVVVNAENAASGFGLTQKIADELLDKGVDVITGGNHSFDQKDISAYMNKNDRVLRPANYPSSIPGRGHTMVTLANGRKLLVLNIMGRVFMNPLDCPFRTADQILAKYPLSGSADLIFVDMHGEATSEKMAIGQYLDGRVTMVIGTHSHIPTADAQILPGGTAYQTDAGMCGDYDSVIGMDKNEPIQRFLSRVPKDRYKPALGEATLCGVYLESDDKTGLALRVEPVRIGPRLAEHIPSLSEA